MGSTAYRRLAFLVAATVIAVDQVAKLLAVHYLAAGPVHLFGGVHLQLFRNYAGPGGSWAGHTVLISVFTVVAAIALAVVAEVHAVCHSRHGETRRLSATDIAEQVAKGGASRYLQTQCALDAAV